MVFCVIFLKLEWQATIQSICVCVNGSMNWSLFWEGAVWCHKQWCFVM